MRTIWKFPLELTDSQSVQMPEGAEILTVQLQGQQLCLWAIVDNDEAREWRTFEIHSTGNPLPDYPGRYVGTFQRPLVTWHVFEV